MKNNILPILCGPGESNKGLSCAANASPNPCRSVIANINKSVSTIQRIDDAGLLYSMTYQGDYYCKEIEEIIGSQLANIDFGCSAFMTYNIHNDVLACRNYDYQHNDKNGRPTGLMLVLKCSPQGKYRSLATVDLYWLDTQNRTMTQGALDDGETDLSALAVAPFLCVDGMNEKGLTVSALKLDLKAGETTTHQQEAGKDSTVPTILLRHLLDECSTVEEAINVADSNNMVAQNGTEVHLFVTDASGESAVFEWRHNKFQAVNTDAVTNFYVGYDDAEAYYNQGQLRELPIKLENTEKGYHYGYGHGYHRFAGIVANMERFIDYTTPDHKVIMDDTSARDILRNASQEPNVEATSQTQASVIFNAIKLNATYWIWRNYNKPYVFNFD